MYRLSARVSGARTATRVLSNSQSCVHSNISAAAILPALTHTNNILPLQSTTVARRQLSTAADDSTAAKVGFWDKLIAKHGSNQILAPDDYNRWKAVPLAVSTHLCLGACYAWSIFNEPLTRQLGAISSSANDWIMSDVMGTFMGIIIFQGISMALCGKWVERVGPRITGVVGSSLYGGGMLLGAAGVHIHSLPLLYAGYGAIAGSGMGLAYLAPMATLIKWFPDKRGLATGMAICGFGGGAIFIAQLKRSMLKSYFEEPEFVGKTTEVVTERAADGRLLAQLTPNTDISQWSEVVSVSATELTTLAATIGRTLEEGLYLVGSGSSGVAETMGTLGAGYFVICLGGSLFVKIPKPGWMPEGMKEQLAKQALESGGKDDAAQSAIVPKDVYVEDVMRTPQFWLQWCTFLSTATVGMGLMSCCKDVLFGCFAHSAAMKTIALGPTAFAATYVQALSFANLSGRFCWSSFSDYLGRKNTFALFGCIGAPLYFTLPWIVSSALEWESKAPLLAFYGSTMFIISFFGGGYATVPAYETDLFGSRFIASIHGRMMTASAVSGLLGPSIFAKLRQREEVKAIRDLTEKCDISAFSDKFGASTDKLDALIESKAVNIAKLLDICPDGTTDPTPFLYDPAFRAMGGVLACGALANFMVRPVNEKHLLANKRPEMLEQPIATAEKEAKKA